MSGQNINNVFKEHFHRFKKPWCMSFCIHFMLYILILGCLGAWIPLIMYGDLKESISNLPTFAIALLLPALVTIEQTLRKSKYPVSWNGIIKGVICFAVLLLILSYNNNFMVSVISSISMTVLAIIYWVIANSDNIYLNDEAYLKNEESYHKKINNETAENHGHGWE